MASDPTIPELVARLRELHRHARTGKLLIGESKSVRGAGLTLTIDACDLVREWNVAGLITETLNALPTLLDALDHIGDANKMVAHSPDGGKVEQQPSRALLRQVWQTAHASGMLVGDKTVREVAEQRERDLDHFLSYPPGFFDEQ